MEREIEIPKCCNYTDLREKSEKKGLSEIEKEKLAEMVKAMSFEEKSFVVQCIESDILIFEIQRQLIHLKSIVKRMKLALEEDF